MLVVTRKTDEKILIGEDIKVTLVAIRGGSVRLGIEAPENIRILREELKERINRDPRACVA
jgi:carbon storage regulator CsrA